MSFPAWLRSFTAKFFHREALAQEMEEELRAHIALRADDLERTGLSRAEAERRARIDFGAAARYSEESFAALGGNFLYNVLRDIRISLRVLRKSPGFTVAAVVTLALAIGANALVFALLNALILRPLNVPQPDTFYALDSIGPLQYSSYPEYLDLRDRNHSFTAISAENIAAAAIDTGNNPSRAWLVEVSGSYFDLIGIQPYLGRVFHASDERGANSAPYIVLSYAYWRSHFQADRGVIGRAVQVNRHPYTIIGVAPPSFMGSLLIFSPDFWIPIVNEQADSPALLTDRGNHWISGMVARLKPGVTPEQAAADLNAIRLELNRAYPRYENKEPYCLVRPGLGGNFLGPSITAFISGLMLLAILILPAACANLGSLFAARAADRSREIALRLALGARRARILHQLFTEAILVSLLGGAIGLCGSMFLLRAMGAWHPFPEFPLNIPVTPDARVYLFALGMALASGFLFGAVPVRQILRTDPYQVVKTASLAAGKISRRISARDILLVAQIAICAILVTASMVAVRGLIRTLHVYVGFDPANVLLADTDLGMVGYTGDRVPAMQRRMIETVRTIPGVGQVSMISSPPLHMGWDSTTVYSDQTTDYRPSHAAALPLNYFVMPGYFQTARTALLAGRQFTWNDNANSPRVAIVNAEFARKVFGSAAAAINGIFKLRDGSRIQVVGVVEDGKYTANLAEDRQAALFRPMLQSSTSDAWLLIRSPRDPQQLAAEVRDRLHKMDPGLPVFTQTWYTSMNGAFFASRMATVSLGILGLMGAILSLTGIFGMAAYAVSRRLKELGIRVALGARRGMVLRTALGRALNLLACGSAAGLVVGLLASRLLAHIVYQATPRDPFVLAGVVLSMALLGLFATWIPAQRALAVDPIALLRDE